MNEEIFKSYFQELFESYIQNKPDRWLSREYFPHKVLKVTYTPNEKVIIDSTSVPLNLGLKILAKSFEEIYQTYKKEYDFLAPQYCLIGSPVEIVLSVGLRIKKDES